MNEKSLRWVLYLGAALGCLQVLAFLFMAVSYALAPGYLDHFEASVAEAALRVLYGIPVFHTPDAAERYSSLYGPTIYWITALFVAPSSSVVMGSKLMGLTGATMFLVALVTLIWKRRGGVPAMLLSGYVLLNLLMQAHFGYWVRPEPMLLLAVAVALWAFELRDWRFSAVLLGVCCSILFNAKVHTVLPLLPLFGVIAFEKRWRYLAITCLVALIVTVLPFCFYHVFYFPNFLDRLAAAGSHGLRSFEFLGCVKKGILASIPVMVVLWLFRAPEDRSERFAQRLFLLLLAAAATLTTIIASKPGAGPHHLMVYFPVVAYFMAWRTEGALQRMSTAWWCILLLGLFFCRAQFNAIRTQKEMLNLMGKLDGTVLEDLRAIRDTHLHESIQMAPVEAPDFAITLYRPELRRPNSVSFIDGTALMDIVESGEAISETTINIVRQEKVDVWLVPKNAKPFSLRTLYPSHKEMFPEAIRKAFAEQYTLVETTRHFDLYRANRLLDHASSTDPADRPIPETIGR